MAKSTLPVLESGPRPVPDGFTHIGKNCSTAKGCKGFRIQHRDHLTRLVCDGYLYALPMPDAKNKPQRAWPGGAEG